MAGEIHWIKLSTEMFSDEKITVIADMPEGDALVLIWVRLLLLAGKCNQRGELWFTAAQPYTDELLATVLRKDIKVVRMALSVFQEWEMLDVQDGVFCPTNWDKHQSVEGMDRVRDQARLRQQRHREKKDEIEAPKKQDEIEAPKEKVPTKPAPPYEEIIAYLNKALGSGTFRHTTQATQRAIKARFNENYTLEDFTAVIDDRIKEWAGDPEKVQYLTPDTMFRPSKFEKYLVHARSKGKVVQLTQNVRCCPECKAPTVGNTYWCRACGVEFEEAIYIAEGAEG